MEPDSMSVRPSVPSCDIGLRLFGQIRKLFSQSSKMWGTEAGDGRQALSGLVFSWLNLQMTEVYTKEYRSMVSSLTRTEVSSAEWFLRSIKSFHTTMRN